jgi:hypothetical protein
MIVQQIAKSKNDEFYTPSYAIKPILEYIKPNSKIWCPFDTEESLYVKVLSEAGHTVYYSHISNGRDFFTSDVPNCDYIISNPPYSLKSEVLKRLFEIGKPFAMLVCLNGLFENQKRFDMFKNNVFEVMYFNRRVSYFKDYKEQKEMTNPAFPSIYLCSKMLPQQIVFKELSK